LERPLGVAVLPGVDAGLLAALEQLDDPLRRVPVGHVPAEQPVEVRVAVDRVAAEDQPRHCVRPELDRRQQGRFPRRGRARRPPGGRPRARPRGPVQEVPPRGGAAGRLVLAHRNPSGTRATRPVWGYLTAPAPASHTKTEAVDRARAGPYTEWSGGAVPGAP